ncbi:Small RNA 2'-O-methyltransferase (HEN1 methyltransferase homolog) (DmHen1) (piRNA methyltransferase), partial [Durusdinium trenchii]
PQALFCLQPQVVIVTSPNADFGDSSDEEDEVPVGGAHLRAFRHSDHEREWTREEFRAWSETVAEQHGYWISELGGVGFLPEMEAHGPCTQLCIFERKEVEETPATEPPVDTAAADTAADAEVDVELLVSQALRSEELG